MAAFILVSVTALSLGIRHLRVSAQRAHSVASVPAVRGAVASVSADEERAVDVQVEDEGVGEQEVYAAVEEDYQSEQAEPSDVAVKKQAAVEPAKAAAVENWEEKKRSSEYSKSVSMKKMSKGDYGKYDGPKISMQKITIGDGENVYITGEGEQWFVSSNPDGSTTKMRLEPDTTVVGEVIVISSGQIRSHQVDAVRKDGGERDERD